LEWVREVHEPLPSMQKSGRGSRPFNAEKAYFSSLSRDPKAELFSPS
jgi:hypothetical protein